MEGHQALCPLLRLKRLQQCESGRGSTAAFYVAEDSTVETAHTVRITELSSPVVHDRTSFVLQQRFHGQCFVRIDDFYTTAGPDGRQFAVLVTEPYESTLTDRIYRLKAEEFLCAVQSVEQAVQGFEDMGFSHGLLDSASSLCLGADRHWKVCNISLAMTAGEKSDREQASEMLWRLHHQHCRRWTILQTRMIASAIKHLETAGAMPRSRSGSTNTRKSSSPPSVEATLPPHTGRRVGVAVEENSDTDTDSLSAASSCSMDDTAARLAQNLVSCRRTLRERPSVNIMNSAKNNAPLDGPSCSSATIVVGPRDSQNVVAAKDTTTASEVHPHLPNKRVVVAGKKLTVPPKPRSGSPGTSSTTAGSSSVSNSKPKAPSSLPSSVQVYSMPSETREAKLRSTARQPRCNPRSSDGELMLSPDRATTDKHCCAMM